MKVAKEVLNVWINSELFFAGRSKQSVEDDFKLMLKQKRIDVDDYSNAMEIIYKDEEVKT